MSDSRSDIRQQQRESESDDYDIVREAIRQTFFAENAIREAVAEALRESDAQLYATSAGRRSADPFDIAPEGN